MQDKILYLTSPLELRQPPDGDSLATRFDGTAYSGAVISEWGYRFVVDLASTQVLAPSPLLNEHSRRDPVGLISQAQNTGAAISISGDLHSDLGGSAELIARRAAKGFPYQLSIGLYDIKEEALIKAGESVEINQRQLQGPLTVLRGGTVRETSVVVLGADSSTNAAFFSSRGLQEPSSTTLPSTGAHPMTTEDHAAQNAALLDQITSLEAAIAARDEELSSLREKINQAELAQKTSIVTQILAASGMKMSEEAAAPFLEMSVAQLEAIRSLPTKKGLPKELTQELAVGDTTDEEASPKVALSLADIYGKRQVAE